MGAELTSSHFIRFVRVPEGPIYDRLARQALVERWSDHTGCSSSSLFRSYDVEREYANRVNGVSVVQVAVAAQASQAPASQAWAEDGTGPGVQEDEEVDRAAEPPGSASPSLVSYGCSLTIRSLLEQDATGKHPERRASCDT